MPIETKHPLRPLTQDEFGQIAFEVMEQAFAVHNELGRLFDEEAYQAALRQRLGPGASTEVWIRARHGDFSKTYFIDLVVGGGGLFELKAVEWLTDAHRNQLLNYLLLAGLHHGKLINFRPERVEHEFVNTSLTHADRTEFTIDQVGWDMRVPGSGRFKTALLELLADWGTCLDVHLYEEAMVHRFGGAERVWQQVDVVHEGRVVGRERVPLVSRGTSFRITAFPEPLATFELHLRRFLEHTALNHILWANVTLHRVTFRTISA